MSETVTLTQRYARHLAETDGHDWTALPTVGRADYLRRAELHLVASDDFMRVDPDALAAARQAAIAADSARRLLDLHHLRAHVIHTDQGPAVLWAQIERVMPVPGRESGPGTPSRT